MNEIPEQIKKVALSIEFGEKIKAVGDSFGLHVDQIGELAAEIRDILFGIKKSANFTSDIVDRLEINKDLANDIAAKINSEIFKSIKSDLQNQNSNGQHGAISSLEQIGNFTMEPVPDAQNHVIEQVERPEEVIDGIENPVPSKPQSMNIPTKPEVHTDLLVDHLLSGPVVAVEKKTEQKVPLAPKAPVQQVKKQNGPDSYREPIE